MLLFQQQKFVITAVKISQTLLLCQKKYHHYHYYDNKKHNRCNYEKKIVHYCIITANILQLLLL